MRLEEMQMENEYQLRLKDIKYNEKIKELSDKFTEQIESLQKTQQVSDIELAKSSTFSPRLWDGIVKFRRGQY